MITKQRGEGAHLLDALWLWCPVMWPISEGCSSNCRNIGHKIVEHGSAEPAVELLETKEIELFIPVLKEIDFGDRFLLSMLHWCGIGQRPTPLEFWKVFLLQAGDEVVGVSGLYRQPGTSQRICWVGWFGIRPRFRRQGFGTSAVHALFEVAHNIGCEELWVYTGCSDDIAVRFYKSLGFEVLGQAADWATGRTMEDSDVIMKRIL